jgi:hypothetical protein
MNYRCFSGNTPTTWTFKGDALTSFVGPTLQRVENKLVEGRELEDRATYDEGGHSGVRRWPVAVDAFRQGLEIT